jgi:hypothetical protein
MKELILNFDSAKHGYGPNSWKTLLSGKESIFQFDLGPDYTQYTINWDRAFGRTDRNNRIYGDYVRMQQGNILFENHPIGFGPYIDNTPYIWYNNYTPAPTNTTYTIRLDE